MNEYIRKKKEIASKLENLNKLDKWKYLRWERLRRNIRYNSENKSNRGLYYQTVEFISKIEKSERKEADKKKIVEVELFFFRSYCGLCLPVDPVSGTWEECKWDSPKEDYYIKEYLLKTEEEIVNGTFPSRLQKDLLKLKRRKLQYSIFNSPFRSVKEIKRFTPDYGSPEEVEDGNFIFEYKGFKERIDVESIALGLAVFDLKKSDRGKVLSFPEITELLNEYDVEKYGVREKRSPESKIKKSYNETKAKILETLRTDLFE